MPRLYDENIAAEDWKKKGKKVKPEKVNKTDKQNAVIDSSWVVETKVDLENIKEKYDTGLFLEAGHYHRAGDGLSGDTISDSLREPIPPFLVIRGAV